MSKYTTHRKDPNYQVNQGIKLIFSYYKKPTKKLIAYLYSQGKTVEFVGKILNLSQQANDFLNQKYGRAIASQSSLRILMKQDTTTFKNVAQEFNLSEYEQKFLMTCDRGEALIIADQNHVSLKVVASEKEHLLLTTDPREIYI